MALLQDLIRQIEDPDLRERILRETDALLRQKKFGLVFEDHLPECTPLYDVSVKVGAKVAERTGYVSEIYTVLSIDGDDVLCDRRETHEQKHFSLADLVTVAEFGEAIYPSLQLLDSVEHAPESDLWHTLIEADNYHALQLLEYLYPGKVDCIYIDPPYNTGAKDWKYNNDYVDGADQYRHSKWLSMMEKRLKLAKKLLNPQDSVLIVTIDEKEYLHLGCLLEEIFSDANMQMVSSVINRAGTGRKFEFSRTDEYLFFLRLGNAAIAADKSNATNKPVVWDTLRRSGPTNTWSKTKKQFFPVFVNDATKKIQSIGEPLIFGRDKIEDVVAPLGCTAVFPIRDNGMEMMWGCVGEEFLNRLSHGYIKVGKYTPNKPQKYVISYLTSGIIADIASGKAVVKSILKDGSVDAYYTEDKEIPPTTNWQKPSHDAQWYGSNLIKPLLGNRFSYPKSLYAVKDCIDYCVRNKPDALVLDFFAGSGTTLHAVNLLNAEDGGHRRCILVTNNEVSAEEAKRLSAEGKKPGDAAWDALGIARYVTWPRTRCSILGVDVKRAPLSGTYGAEEEVYVPDDEASLVSKKTNKPIKKTIYVKKKVPIDPKLSAMKMADGFRANAAFFKLSFLDKNALALGRQFAELLPVLWMKGGAVGRCPVLSEGDLPAMLILSENRMAVLTDETRFPEFQERMKDAADIETIFFVTDSEAAYKDMVRHYGGRACYQLYRDYLDNFRINVRRSGR